MSKVRRLPASYVAEWYKLSVPDEGEENPAQNYCSIDHPEWYTGDYGKYWENSDAKIIRKWMKMSDRINKTLHQIDNTAACGGTDNIIFCGLDTSDKILRLLTKYNLIYLDVPAPAWTANQLFKYADEEINFGDISEMRDILIETAFEKDILGILTAFEIGSVPPPDRRSYWLKIYSEQLGTKDINYWEWFANPESREICDELSLLLTLPAPSNDVQTVLTALSHGRDPWLKKPLDRITFSDIMTLGKFFNYADDRRSQLRHAFKEWHYQTLELLGQPQLAQIYQRIYNCNWEVIESALGGFTGDWYEILSVPKDADYPTVQKAWKRLAKIYHPDVNPHGIARMQLINVAWGEFQKFWESRSRYRR